MKAAIIGCGSISRVHAQTLSLLGHEIVALCDNVAAHAQALKEEQSLSCQIYTDLRDMLAQEQIDVLHVCTPHYLHAPMICEGLRAGVAVFSEKPVCISHAQEEEIRSALKETGGYLGVCFQNRFLPASIALHDALAGKKIKGAAAQVLWNRNKDYYQSGDWRGKWATEGGGVLINQALHTLDLTLWCLGVPNTLEASIANHHLKEFIEVEDTVEAALFYPDFHALFYASTAMYYDESVRLDIATEDHVYGVRADKFYVDGKEACVPALPEKASALIGKGCWGVGHLLCIDRFYSDYAQKIPFAIDLEQAIGAVRATIAVYASKGKEISL